MIRYRNGCTTGPISTATEWCGAKMGPEQNRELIRYYPDRQVWGVEADDRTAKLDEYSVNTDTPSSEYR